MMHPARTIPSCYDPILCEACGKELRGGPLDHLTDEDRAACPAWGTPEHLQAVADHPSLHEHS